MVLKGEFECKIDEKGRIMFPSSLKKQLQGVIDEGFIIKKNLYSNCLEVYPMCEWNKMISKLENKNHIIKKIDVVKRSFLFSHREVNLDGSGRFMIPKDLMESCGLAKDVWLATQINKIEIWDRDKYIEEGKIINNNPDLEDMINNVMSQNNND